MKNIILVIVILAVTNLKAQEVLYLTLQPVEKNATEKVYNFIVDDFKNMVGWQFSMLFDGTKMKFKEIRNPILDDMTNHEFNEASPGVLLTSWIDKDLHSNDYTDPTVVFQIVFELLQPEGSTVCMSESPLAYEFIRRDVPGQAYLTEVNISDDCHISLPLILNTTAVDNPTPSVFNSVQQANLSKEGELTFTNTADQTLAFQLYDLSGRLVQRMVEQPYTSGRQVIDLGRNIIEGMYILQVRSCDGRNTAISLLAK